MTLEEIKAAIMAGLQVGCVDSKSLVTIEQVNPLFDLSVKSKISGYIYALEPRAYDDCFIIGG